MFALLGSLPVLASVARPLAGYLVALSASGSW